MCNCQDPGHGGSRNPAIPTARTVASVPPAVPLAASIHGGIETQGPDDQGAALTPTPVPILPIPPLKPCRLDFRDGCYVITHRPTPGLLRFEGTLRVDRAAPDGGPDNIIVSGDLYRAPLVIQPLPVPVGPALPVGDEADEEAASGARAPSLSIEWSAQGIAVGAYDGVDVFIDFPVTDVDNHAAGLVMHPEVGKWVALGGGAYHLQEAVRRLHTLSGAAAAADAGPPARLLESFDGLLPDRARVARLFPALADAGRGPARGGRPGRRAPAAARRRSPRRKR